MSNLTLEDKLALSKKVSRMEEQKMPISNAKKNNFSGSLESIDNMVYGDNFILNEGEKKPYDANEEMKRIKQGFPTDISNCRLPSSILESIRSNPLNNLSEDPKLDAFTNKLSKILPEGVKKFNQIQEKLDEADNKKANSQSSNNTSVNIDYDLIQSIIENTVNKALNNAKQTLLTETTNKNNNDNNLKAIKLGSKFLFLDSDDNVYECKMVYKGKNKKRK